MIAIARVLHTHQTVFLVAAAFIDTLVGSIPMPMRLYE
jgi:hypothetical protein